MKSKIEKFKLLGLYVTDKTGITLEGNNVADQEYFIKAIAGETFVSSPQSSANGSSSTITVAGHLWESGMYDTKIVGTVFAVVDGAFLSNITNKIQVGESGRTYIVDKLGNIIANADQNMVNSQENNIELAKTDASLSKLAQLEKRGLNGETCFGEVELGVKKMLFITPIEQTNGWIMGVYVDKNEFMATTYISIMISIGITLLALIIAEVIMLTFANRMVKPIKKMETAVFEVSKGNYDVDICCKPNDEIGNMAESMREMILITRGIIEDTARSLEEMSKGNFDLSPQAQYIGIYNRIKNAIITY